MAFRYDRALSPCAKELVSHQGPLRFLITTCIKAVEEPVPLDVQLRERDHVMVYHGRTCLLDIAIREDHITCKASPSYGQAEKKCAKSYHQLMHKWIFDDAKGMEQLETLIPTYLRCATMSANARFFENRKEGYWQNWLCVQFGRLWRPEDHWLIVDQEVVIGHEDKQQRDSFMRVCAKYEKIRNRLQEENARKWGRPDQKKKLGNELDLIAIDAQQRLVCIELKHGTSTNGIYWSPLQASVYHDINQAASSELKDGVIELVNQKVALGLLPKEALQRVSEGLSGEVISIIAVAEPNWRSTCWPRMSEVMDKCDKPSFPLYLFNKDHREPEITTIKDAAGRYRPKKN